MGAAESTAKVDFDSMDFYEILGISEDATSEEIKRAYRQRALEHHPDKNKDDTEGATKRFAKVHDAYETLTDEMRRTMYNYDRAAKPSEQSPHSSPESRSCSSGVPGAWASDNSHNSSASSWYDWFFRPSSKHPHARPCPQAKPRRRSRFVFEDYAARSRHRGPGITANDIVEFVNSLPEEVDWFADDQGDQNPFTVFNNFFQCLAHDESQWSTTAKTSGYPSFGNLDTVWQRDKWNKDEVDPDAYEARQFYAFWTKFNTEKTFEWVVRFGYIPGTLTARDERWVKKENKRYQDFSRQQYNKLVRALADMLFQLDPRPVIHMAMSEGQAGPSNEQEKQKQRTKQKKKDKKRNRKKKW